MNPVNPKVQRRLTKANLDFRVAISPFALQKGDRGYHRCNNQDVGYSMRQHVSHDCFRIFGEGVTLDQLPHLLFQSSMAAQKAYTATLQPPHTRVLKRRVLGVGVGGRGNSSGVICELAEIIWISYGRLTGARIIDLQPRADLVFLPNIIIVVEKVGWSMYAAD